MNLTEESKQGLRKMFLDMRQEIMDQMRVQHRAARENDHRGDMGDRTASSMNTEYAFSLSERLKEKVLLVDEALDAIENGDYGICDECERPINEKRLLSMPFARLCVPCQSELEKRTKFTGQTNFKRLYRRAV
jgi:DnaK suppressor protein